MKITYFLEVISSWCYWAEPAWAELRSRYAGKAEISWQIALMDGTGMPKSAAQCDWFYRRSGTLVRSPFMLNSGWFDPALTEYLSPNLVAEAAKDFGITDDRVRLALARGALREGHKVGDWNTAVRIAVAAAPESLEAAKLLEAARSPAVEERTRAATDVFHALGITQRPAFVLENALGDRAVLSGLAGIAPLLAVADALYADEVAQLSYNLHHGDPPAA